IQTILEDGLRTMKTSQEPVPVILVGGGAILAPDKLAGASEVHRPENSGVANAIGASIALIGGEAERFVNYAETPRETALEEVKQAATEVAVSAGAVPASIRTTDMEETVIPYMDDGAARIRVKVVGDVASLTSAHGGER
ncbi:MAG: hydantoinase/oxoprolinase family protein, partial [Pseudomonadota bacterium]